MMSRGILPDTAFFNNPCGVNLPLDFHEAVRMRPLDAVRSRDGYSAAGNPMMGGFALGWPLPRS